MQPENSVQAMAMIKPRSEVDFENATVGDVMSGDVFKAGYSGEGVTNKAGGDQGWASHKRTRPIASGPYRAVCGRSESCKLSALWFQFGINLLVGMCPAIPSGPRKS